MPIDIRVEPRTPDMDEVYFYLSSTKGDIPFMTCSYKRAFVFIMNALVKDDSFIPQGDTIALVTYSGHSDIQSGYGTYIKRGAVFVPESEQGTCKNILTRLNVFTVEGE